MEQAVILTSNAPPELRTTLLFRRQAVSHIGLAKDQMEEQIAILHVQPAKTHLVALALALRAAIAGPLIIVVIQEEVTAII